MSEEHNMKIRPGVSACLLGRQVRFNGGHKNERFLAGTPGRYVEYVPVCPEVACGMSLPREALRLVGNPSQPLLVTVHTKKDLTQQMIDRARNRVTGLEHEDLCGFILKSRSPGSGMERVRVYNDRGMPSHNGTGMFARVFMEHFPMLPGEEEGRLHDPALRGNYIESIFVCKCWRELTTRREKASGLISFPARHKLLLLAHCPPVYRQMGAMVARAVRNGLSELYAHYHGLLIKALLLKANVKKHTDVLLHIMGYFKKQLAPDKKQELHENIDHYRRWYVPLVVSLTLIIHYVRKYRQPYFSRQYYLNSHPVQLKLRNLA